jgi:hypothetical protein
MSPKRIKILREMVIYAKGFEAQIRKQINQDEINQRAEIEREIIPAYVPRPPRYLIKSYNF